MSAPYFMRKSFYRATLGRILASLLLISLIGGVGALRGQEQLAPEPKSSEGNASPKAAETSLTCVDPLVKVFRGAADLPPAKPEEHAAVGEFATIQFVFRSPAAIDDLQATVSEDVPGAAARLRRLRQSRAFLRRHAGRCLEIRRWNFSDPLLEDKSVAVAADQNQPIWITVPAKTPGKLSGKLTLRWKRGEMSVPFSVHVHNVKMNKPRLGITNWWFSDAERLSMLAGHKVEPYSEEYWKLIRQFADFMAQYHQNMVLVSPLDLAQITFKEDKWYFDFSRFDKMVRTFADAGVVGRIEGGHLGGRSSDVSTIFVRVPKLSGGAMQFVNMPATDPAARHFYGQFLPALAEHLASRGWKEIYRQHLADEPIDDNAASYQDIAALVHEFAPGCASWRPRKPAKSSGAVDTWVPILDQFHRNYEFFVERQKAGDEVWFYTCCAPAGNYANRFIELPLIKTRLLHWINFRYGATGYLHWGFNCWNPSTSPFAETAFQWPGGDQWIVYPKDGKLLSSIRLEAMRDGIGDHELLSMLAERDAAAARKLAAETVLDFDRYDADVARFRAHRLQLLEALAK